MIELGGVYRRALLVLLVLVVVMSMAGLLACGGDNKDPKGPADTGTINIGLTDTGPVNPGTAETRPNNPGTADAGRPDIDRVDAGRADGGPTEAAPKDTGEADTDPVDTGVMDAQESIGEEDAATDSLEFTNVDVSNDTTRRFGAPLIAINPTDPDNIVVLASSNMGYTASCQPAAPGSDCELIPQYIDNFVLANAPRGFYKTPGFCDIGVFASFDRGETFTQVDVSQMHPIGHPEISAKGEGPLVATADGTFYIGFNAINWGDWEANPPVGFPNGGVGAIKSTDGGLTWSGAWLTGTPADWPFGCADQSTGTIYVVSGTPMSDLGPRATGDPNSPPTPVTDRWIASSQDGENWTTPQPLGGTDGSTHISASHSAVSAAHGVVATMFVAGDAGSCQFFVGDGTAPCIVFQTSTDAGATWSRHRLPAPAQFTPSGMTGLMFAADPSTAGHFAAVILNAVATEFWMFQTHDSGNTWSEPTVVTEDASKGHFGTWAAYSPNGVLGVMWRSNESPDPDASTVYPPYSVWAVISEDGGTTFSSPLKVSKTNSPPLPATDIWDMWNGHVGDHGHSAIELDGDRAYIAWADWTPGERSIFFSAIKFQAFTQQ